MKGMSGLVFSVGLVTLAVALAPAADWTQFRGPGGTGVSGETNLPVKWDKTEGLRYKVALPGRGVSNPVIAGGRVYVTASSGYRENRLHVLCFDEATGKKLWERSIKSTGNTGCHPMTCMAAPTPVTDGKAVYALFATADLVAIDREGTLLWYRSLVSDYPNIFNQVGMAASPVLAGKALIVPMENADDSFVAGLDVATGKNLWRLKRSKNINWVTPIVLDQGGRTSVLFPMPGHTSAVDPMTGKVRWSLDEEGVSVIPSPSFKDGILYMPANRGLTAYKPGDLDSKPQRLWSIETFAGGFSSPICHADRIYGLTQANVVAVSTADGSEQGKVRIEGPFHASPVIADGKLYAVNNKGKTFVVALGKELEVLARNDLEDTILATPAIANGCIYLRSDNYLYCIGPRR